MVGAKWGGPMQTGQILIKRFARSRFYDAANRRYVSIEELRQWRREGVSFVVRDAETGADVTRVVLA